MKRVTVTALVVLCIARYARNLCGTRSLTFCISFCLMFCVVMFVREVQNCMYMRLSLFNLKRFYGAQRKSHIHCWKAHLPILFSFTVPSTWSSAYVGAKTCEFGTWSWVPHRSVPLDPILSPCILFASTLLILLCRSIAEHLHRHRPVGIHALYDSKYLCRVRKRAFGRGLCVVGREKENISCALFVFFPF